MKCPPRCVEVFAQDEERFELWITSDANAAEAKLKEAAAAPGAWRAIDWKVSGERGGGVVLDGAPAATVPLQGATPAGAEDGTLDDHASLPRRQEHLSYTTVPQLEGTTNVWELF